MEANAETDGMDRHIVSVDKVIQDLTVQSVRILTTYLEIIV